MEQVLIWIKSNYATILEIIGAVVTLATIIVKLTKSEKDDAILSKIIKVLSIFSLVNPDGSFIGKKEDK